MEVVDPAELLALARVGDVDLDERAADALFQRYMERLTLLARTRLSSRLATRTDPEDIYTIFQGLLNMFRLGHFHGS